jgi:hypothetical protein
VKPDLDQVVADVVGRRAVEEAHAGYERFMGMLDDPDRTTSLLLGEVGDQAAEMVGVARAVLVLDADGHHLTVLVEGARKDVEALAEHVVLGTDGGEVFKLQGHAEHLEALRLLQPWCEVAGLAPEHITCR